MILFNLLMLIIIISLFCNGLFMLTSAEDDLVFSFVGKWLDRVLAKRANAYHERHKVQPQPKECDNACACKEKKPVYVIDQKAMDKYTYRWSFLYNPVFSCITCMASVWGYLLYQYFIGLENTDVIELIIVVVCSSAMNTLIYKIIHR